MVESYLPIHNHKLLFIVAFGVHKINCPYLWSLFCVLRPVALMCCVTNSCLPACLHDCRETILQVLMQQAHLLVMGLPVPRRLVVCSSSIYRPLTSRGATNTQEYSACHKYLRHVLLRIHTHHSSVFYRNSVFYRSSSICRFQLLRSRR